MLKKVEKFQLMENQLLKSWLKEFEVEMTIVEWIQAIGITEELMERLKKVIFMFLKMSYFEIGLIFEKAEPFGNSWMSCDPFKIWMVSLTESMQKWLGWKEEEEFEALRIHL